MCISLKLFLLFSELFVHFKQWNLEKAVETTLFQTRDSPLNDNINLFLFVSGLHFEFTDNKSLFLIEIVGFFGAIENTDYSLEWTLLINND
jgi:hypothetical protein